MQRLTEPFPFEKLQHNLERVRACIAAAAARAQRNPAQIRLIAVTKYSGLSEVQNLYKLGIRDFGESRIQECEPRIKAMQGTEARWHLIGHLQTNKADKAVRLFQSVHSIDSSRVADALNKEALKTGYAPIPCYLEVNVAGEANKYGLAPSTSGDLRDALLRVANSEKLKPIGLMAMAPYAEHSEPTSRPVFRRLRELLGELNALKLTSEPLTELSMGMTQDFEIAIEEGATCIRVGSALFE